MKNTDFTKYLTNDEKNLMKENQWKYIKRSFMQKSFGESMCKETKHNILKFFEDKLTITNILF